MSNTLEQLQYGFDRDSRRTWRQRATTQGWDNAYAYDSLSQVIGDDRGDLNLTQNAVAGVPSTGSRWDYDETGNWHGYQMLQNGAAVLNQGRTHDKGNRLMEVAGAAAMRTDRAGRMIQLVPGPQQDWSQSWQVTWDAWSRITQISHVEGSEIHNYAYDGMTRRTSRTNNQSGVTLHSYYNNQWRPVEERKNSENTAAISYLWGARHRDDLVRRDRAVGGTAINETRYILMDYFSPAAITDGVGVVKERYAFSAFGVRTILNPDFTPRTSSECGMEFSFKGQFEDSETGWMNYGYRYYLPALGRWSRKDPIGIRGALNLYELTFNSPLNFTDYLGLASGVYKSKDEAGAAGAKAAKDLTNKSDQRHFDVLRNNLLKKANDDPGPGNVEYCGRVCCKGKEEFYYTEPAEGVPPDNIFDKRYSGKCDPAKSPSCSGKDKQVGEYHSHPDSGPFSPEDKERGDKTKMTQYVGRGDRGKAANVDKYEPDPKYDPNNKWNDNPKNGDINGGQGEELPVP